MMSEGALAASAIAGKFVLTTTVLPSKTALVVIASNCLIRRIVTGVYVTPFESRKQQHYERLKNIKLVKNKVWITQHNSSALAVHSQGTVY